MRLVVNNGQYKITIPKELAESKGWKAGTILRFVEDIDGNGIGGATIQILDGATVLYPATTSLGPTPPLGKFTIDDVTCGTYDMIASAGDYVSSVKSNVVLPSQESLIVDFTGNDALIIGSTCEEDCTTAADNIIHKECDGINGCAFNNDDGTGTAKEVCNFAQPGWIRDYSDTQVIECAEGTPQLKVETKAEVTCELENLLKLTKVVVDKGKLVNLNIVKCG